jgi:hypothetical protein
MNKKLLAIKKKYNKAFKDVDKLILIIVNYTKLIFLLFRM